jgi:hypothetical protein
MKKILFLFLMPLATMAQKSITFDIPNAAMLYTQTVNGANIVKSYPIATASYTYQAELNRITIYSGNSPRITVFSGSFSEITVSGKTSTGEKLDELNQRIGSSSSTNNVFTPIFTQVVSRNSSFIETSSTYTISSEVLFYSVCNVGLTNATVRDNSTNTTMTLYPGMCISDQVRYRQDTQQTIKVNSVFVNATGTTCSIQFKNLN